MKNKMTYAAIERNTYNRERVSTSRVSHDCYTHDTGTDKPWVSERISIHNITGRTQQTRRFTKDGFKATTINVMTESGPVEINLFSDI